MQIHYSPTFEVPSFDNQTNSQRGIKPAAMFVISPSLSVMGGLSDMARVEKTKLSTSAMLSQDFLELNHIPLNICERFHGVVFFFFFSINLVCTFLALQFFAPNVSFFLELC